MSGNGSRKRSKEYGTKGPLLPTPRPCSGLRSSGINQTEIMMSLERQDSGASHSMTTSKPSQPPLFADGSAKPDQVLKIAYWPTPNTLDVMPERENVRAWNNDRDGRKNRTVLSNLRNAVSDEIYDRSISSPAAIPASHSLSPGSDWARKMTGISGRSLRRWLPTSSLAGVFSRMCMDTSRWGSTRCYLTWKRSATPAGRSLFRLVPSAPPIGGIASGFWPTPNVAGGGNQCELTPHKGHYLRPSGQKAHLGLDQAVRMFPTPTAQDAKNNGAPSQMERNTPPLNAIVGGKLSAAWVTRLMGYPDGYLDDLPADPLAGTPDPT